MERNLMALTVLAVYDIANDGRRTRVANRLQSWGDRIQKSVFIIVVEKEELEALRADLETIIDANGDSLLLLPICGRCLKGVDELGQAAVRVPAIGWFVT